MDTQSSAGPEAVAYAFAEAWNDGDAEALAGLFVEDADFVNVVGLWWNRRERIRSAHDYGFRKIFAGSRMELQKVRVRDLGGGTAVVHALWSLSGQLPQAGEEPGERMGVISFVVRQQDGGWSAVSAQNTDRVPGAETHFAHENGGLRPTAYQDLPDSGR